MENQVQTIVCPNCGANATNHNNCEYCGSLLVRFIDKGIELDEQKYGHEAFRFEGLEEALTQNLEEQAKSNGRNHIHTFINLPSLGLQLDVTNPKAQTEVVLYEWRRKAFRIKPTFQSDSDEQSFVICIRFYEITDESWAADTTYSNGVAPSLNKHNANVHARFKGLPIYDLFSLKKDTLVDVETGWKVGIAYQYYLNFGRDVEGAASIITQYLLGSYEIANPQNMILTYKLSSLTDEEYKAMVKKSTLKSRIWFWFVAILCSCSIIAGVYILFVDSEEVIVGLFCLIAGLVALWYSKKKLNG